MKLISCAECGKPISEKAMTCPHCGAPLAEREEDVAVTDELRRHTESTVPTKPK
jgi:uncharacterized membrane protein YvbJ